MSLVHTRARFRAALQLAVLDSETGVSGTTATLTTTYIGDVIAELWSARDGLDSTQRWRHTFAHSNPP